MILPCDKLVQVTHLAELIRFSQLSPLRIFIAFERIALA